MPRLIVTESGNEEPLIHNCLEEIITIGRLEESTLKLPADGVSRQHAKILLEGENFFLIDLKSGNGTFLNGIPLRPNERNLLQAGDLIVIDDYQINFNTSDTTFEEGKLEEVTESDILEVKLLKKVLNALDKETVPSIEVLNGSAEGKKFFFADDTTEIVIGRDPETDFPINEHAISRRHARISKRWGGIAIRDLDSKNGTFLNNRRVVEEFLHDGDRVALGTIVLIFRNPQEINLTNIEDIRPKNVPINIAPEEIPGLEGEGEPKPEEAYEEEAQNMSQEEGQEKEEASAIEEWEQLEEEAHLKELYPSPNVKKKSLMNLTPMEIGMIGLGVLVLIFALITIVNLISS